MATFAITEHHEPQDSEQFLAIQYHYLPNICGANKPESDRCEHLDLLVACNGCGCGKPKLIGRPDKAKELGVGVLMDCPRWHKSE